MSWKEPTWRIGHGMCYEYQKPKIMRTEEEAKKVAKDDGCRYFLCPHCGMHHISKSPAPHPPATKGI